jgi:hypothetical protein
VHKPKTFHNPSHDSRCHSQCKRNKSVAKCGILIEAGARLEQPNLRCWRSGNLERTHRRWEGRNAQLMGSPQPCRPPETAISDLSADGQQTTQVQQGTGLSDQTGPEPGWYGWTYGGGCIRLAAYPKDRLDSCIANLNSAPTQSILSFNAFQIHMLLPRCRCAVIRRPQSGSRVDISVTGQSQYVKAGQKLPVCAPAFESISSLGLPPRATAIFRPRPTGARGIS